MSKKYSKIVIGIDQSYKNCGISIAADGKLLKVSHIPLEKYKDNSKRRKILSQKLENIFSVMVTKSDNVICVIERIRLHSQGFLNMDYIKSIGALNALIVDKSDDYGIKVYSVDTRAWKSQIIGSSKGQKNSFGVPEEKWPTVKFVIEKGFESSIIKEVKGRKTVGTFIRNGKKYMYDNDASDSAGIALYGFYGNKNLLHEEK